MTRYFCLTVLFLLLPLVSSQSQTQTASKAPPDSDGQAAVYGIRPEHFSLNGKGVVTQVAVIEPMGSETQVITKLGGQKLVGVFRERVSVKPGDALLLAPDPAAVHLFDQVSGQRLN